MKNDKHSQDRLGYVLSLPETEWFKEVTECYDMLDGYYEREKNFKEAYTFDNELYNITIAFVLWGELTK